MREVFSFAIQLYCGMSDEKMGTAIRRGRLLKKSIYCNTKVYEVMECRNMTPDLWPTFGDLDTMLSCLQLSIVPNLLNCLKLSVKACFYILLKHWLKQPMQGLVGELMNAGIRYCTEIKKETDKELRHSCIA